MECVVSGGMSAEAVASHQRYISSDTQTAQRTSAASGRRAPADSSTSSGIFNHSDSQLHAPSTGEMRCDSTDQVAASCGDRLSQCLPAPPTDGSTEQMNRRHRTAFSAEQLRTLEAEFQGENYISRQRRNQLAKQLQLPETTVKIWFQNRRMKNKRQQMTSWPLDPRFTDPTLAAMLLQAAVVSGAFPYPSPSSILPPFYRALPTPQFRPAADTQLMEKAVLGRLHPRHPLSAIHLQTPPPASSWKPNILTSSSDVISAGTINNKLPALFRPFEHTVQY